MKVWRCARCRSQAYDAPDLESGHCFACGGGEIEEVGIPDPWCETCRDYHEPPVNAPEHDAPLTGE